MSGSTSDWLPKHHLGVVATISHADELIEQLGRILFDYQTQPDGIIGLREVPKGSFNQTVVERVAPIPRKIPLLVADVLVALRAALEHSLFSEIEFLEGSPLNEKAARLIEIPAADSCDKFDEWIKKRARNGPRSLQAGSELIRRIASLQPFQNPTAPHEHPLARLVLHTNHAKHRMPAIMAVRLAAMYRDDERPQTISDLAPRPEEPLRIGDVIAETRIGTIVPITLFPTVGINRPGADRWPLLMNELDEISSWVRTQAVPQLIMGTTDTPSGLPTRYEIAVGHNNECQAIMAGSSVSAKETYTLRLGAKSVRDDLTELIARMENSPQEHQIKNWLLQMPDDEVINRMSRLQSGPTTNYGVVLRNLRIMEGFRDEVREFELQQET